MISYGELRDRLRGRFNSEPFRFGYAGYEPFTVIGTEPQGPMYSALLQVAEELRCEAQPVQCTWQNFRDKLERRDIHTMADPIMPFHGRGFSVVPYAKITTNVLLFSSRYREDVEEILRPIPNLVQAALRAQGGIEKNRAIQDLRSRLSSLSEVGEGLAVMKGNTDESALSYLRIKIAKRFSGWNTPEATGEAIDQGFLFLGDMPAARAGWLLLAREGIECRLEHLFGPELPSRTIAGLPVDEKDQDLGLFMRHHVIHSDGIIARVLAGFDRLNLERLGVPLLEPRKLAATLDEPQGGWDWLEPCGLDVEVIRARRTVFLGYVREDFEEVEKVYNHLGNRGFRLWIDKVDLVAGQTWRDELKSVIKSAGIVLLFLSSRSVSKRGFFQKELRWAAETAQQVPEGEGYLIPVRLEHCKVPDLVAHLQRADLYTDEGLQRLVTALDHHISRSQG